MYTKRLLMLMLGLSATGNLFAQLCQGSLGDPVVSITFGSGSNTGLPLSSAVTNYAYRSDFCPNDGFYTIANSTFNCFNGTWLNLSEDHTPGDNNGYMMLVNASFAAGDFYVQKVDGLCGGTTYEFAAWMINIIRPYACSGNSIKPNITFTIETTSGDVLQTYKTGDIKSSGLPTWTQYGLFFTTPANTFSVVLRITNNAPGGCGNDIALDDITFRPCGPKVSINVNGAADNKEVCPGDMSTLNFSSAIVNPYVNIAYQWQKSEDSISWKDIPGANGSAYSTAAIVLPGKYYYRIEVAEGNNISLSSCRVASAFVTINVVSLPNASNSGPACEGAEVTLMSTGAASYLWTGPANFMSTVQSPVIANVSFANSGLYHVTVASAGGCVNYDSTTIVVRVSPVAGAGNNIAICEGTGTVLQGTGINTISYVWTPAEALSDPATPSPLATPLQTTLYVLTAKNGICKDSASVLVTVLKRPVANAGPDKVVTGKQTTLLNGQVTGANLTFFWTPGLYISSDIVLTPEVSPPYDINYTLHAVSNDGCGEDTDTVLVKYFKDVYIPNAFTPNNDGLNDRWNLPALPAFPLAEVWVYNRYGQLIFYNTGYTKQWDGTYKGLPQASGIYTYVIDLKNGFKKMHGIVMLIR